MNASAKDSDDGNDTGPQLAESQDAIAAEEPPPKASLENSATEQACSADEGNVAAESSHESVTSDGDYLLHVSLNGVFEPNIVRILIAPPDLTFDRLHDILQVAFGWAECHAHAFNITSTEGPVGYLGGPLLLSLSADNFMPESYPEPEKMKKESDYTLSAVLEGPEFKGQSEIIYEYDHGDSWNHSITLMGRADPMLKKALGAPDEFRVLCIAGEGHACAEDVGGIYGWKDLKEVFKPRKKDPDDKKDWYKNVCSNGDKKGIGSVEVGYAGRQ